MIERDYGYDSSEETAPEETTGGLGTKKHGDNQIQMEEVSMSDDQDPTYSLFGVAVDANTEEV